MTFNGGSSVEGALAAAGKEDRSNDDDDDEVSLLLTTYCMLGTILRFSGLESPP